MGRKVGRLRRQGLVPANIYGGGLQASIPVQIDVRSLREVLVSAGSTTVVDVHVRSADGSGDGPAHPVLVERVSRHPATGQVLHVDLRQVDLSRPVRAEVPVALIGESPATRAGNVLFHPVDVIEVEALPRDLPHAIEVDVTGLAEVDEQITVADLRLPTGVTVHTDPETLVVKIVASKLEQEVAAEEAETAAAAAEAAAEAGEAAEEGVETPEGEAAGETTPEQAEES
jgi:large subunit ribosomal protein L25